MSDEPRPYRKTRRAEQEAETRLRITKALVELHGTVGPARTSVTAVAERAGVRRSTVYRHFADEAAMFEACSAHWMTSHPGPDLPSWAAIDDPDVRLRRAISELYSYYAHAEPMLGNLLRDADHVPVVAARMQGFQAFLGAAVDVLLAGRGLRGARRRRTAAAIGHVVGFATWRSLAREQGLSGGDAAALAVTFVRAASAAAQSG